MKDIANATTGQLSAIDGLAMQARALRLSINMNMWALARVFVEAKELVPHGEWGKWVEENADVSEKTASDLMAAYRRFGSNPNLAEIGQTKIFRLLPLPEGTEEQFLSDHNVETMSSREIQEAVKEARKEAQAEIDRERQARLEAEQRALDAENRPAEIPPELTAELARNRETIAQQREEVDRLAEVGRESLEEQRRLNSENAGLRKEMQEQEELLREQQEALNRAQEDLLNLQSAQARGDAEHDRGDELTLDIFSAAVREFVGLCARMPYMARSFATMCTKERDGYESLLQTVEGWCAGSRRALDSYSAEGGILIE